MSTRPNIYRSALEHHVHYLMKTKGIDKDTATEFVKKVFKDRLKEPVLEVHTTKRPGVVVPEKHYFRSIQRDLNENIVAPNGRVYLHPSVQTATNRDFVKDILTMRKFHKSKKLEYKVKGLQNLANIEDGIQSRCKMDANTVAGGAKNSPFNPFFDKPGFNATTATARAIIRLAISLNESLLAGNLHLNHEEEALQYFSVILKQYPDLAKSKELLDRYELKYPTVDEVVNYYQGVIRLNNLGPLDAHRDTYQSFATRSEGFFQDQLVHNYVVNSNLTKSDDELFPVTNVRSYVECCCEVERALLYYAGNLKNIMWENEVLFKGWLSKLTTPADDFIDEQVFKRRPEMFTMVMMRYPDKVGGKSFNDIITHEPELYKEVMRYATHADNQLNEVQPLFDHLIYLNCNPQRLNETHKRWRKSVSGSDTDSVLFTRIAWRLWYSGDYFDESASTLTMEELIVYLYCSVLTHHLDNFTLQLGAPEEDKGILNMKNEFTFRSIIFYLIKKHYAGPVLVQEGKVFIEPELDTKGIQLRGAHVPSNICELRDELIVSSSQPISVNYLLKQAVKYEHEIFKDLKLGSTQYLKPTSIDEKDAYDDPDRTKYRQLEWWNRLFGSKYGEALSPGKFLSVFLDNPIGEAHIDKIREIDHKVADTLTELLQECKINKRNPPSGIIINPLLGYIPPELLVLMDLRKHVYTTMVPIYLTMGSFNVPVIFNKQKVLVSDYYEETIYEGR